MLGSLVLVVLFYLNPSSAVYRWPLRDQIRQQAADCGPDWKELESRLLDLPNTDGFSFAEFESAMNAVSYDLLRRQITVS